MQVHMRQCEESSTPYNKTNWILSTIPEGAKDGLYFSLETPKYITAQMVDTENI